MSTVSSLTFNVQLITVDTDLPISEVTARLDHEIHKQGKSEEESILSPLSNIGSKAELESLVRKWTGPSDFLYFGEFKLSDWLTIYSDGKKHPATISYTIGNPLVAQPILRHDIRAAAFIPPRITVIEKEGGGTNMVYYLPSSLVGWSENEDLLYELRIVDKKLEEMMKRITSK